MNKLLLVISTIIFFFSLNKTARAQTSQTVSNGQTTAAENFPGGGCVYNWSNSNPAIGLSVSGTGDIASFTAVNKTKSPITATIAATPVHTSGYAYVANYFDGSVSVININTNTLVSTIPVGNEPLSIAVSSISSRAYAANIFDGTVSVINTKSNSVIATVQVPQPEAVCVSPDGSKVYVTSTFVVTVIDAATNSIIATIPVSSAAYGIVASQDGKWLYVTNILSNTVMVISTTTNSVTATIVVGSHPVSAIMSPDGKLVYITNEYSNTISVINVATNTVISTIPGVSNPSYLAISPDGSKLYVSDDLEDVSIVSTVTNSVITTIKLNGGSSGVSISNDGSRVYVANGYAGTSNTPSSNTVSVINTATNTLIGTIDVGSHPISYGDFVSDCDPISFTITVNPTSPAITAIAPTGIISACAGSPSASPNIQQFAVSGSNLTADITATAPTGFEVSLSSVSGYGSTVTLKQAGGVVTNQIVYVRSASSALAGNISGNVVLTSGTATQNVAVAGVVNALPTVNTIPNQTVDNGALTTAVNFTGAASSYTWVNDTPGIGLPASGTGNITPFNAINTGVNSVKATVTVTPLATGTGCSGMPIKFTITVASDPYATIPSITTGGVTGTISACAGSPSASPNIQQFTVSGSNLTADITATAPTGFEVSLSAISGYGNTVTIKQAGGVMTNQIVYVRSVASASPGNISGNVTLTSAGTATQNVTVTGVVNVLPTVNIVPNQTVNNGASTTAVNFTGTASTYIWTNDTPGIGLAANGTDNIGSFTAVNTGNEAVTATVTVSPISVNGLAYIANENSNTVSVINIGTNSVVATMPVNAYPYSVAVSPDGSKVYVTSLISGNSNNVLNGTVSVINTASNTVTATINVGKNPSLAVLSPDGKLLYVANTASSSISVINTVTNSIISTISTGNPTGLAVSPDGTRLYVTGEGNFNNQVTVFNTATNVALATIRLNYYAVCERLSPDGAKLYVSCNGPFNGQGILLIINTATNQISSNMTLIVPPSAMTISADGSQLYGANIGANTVSVINTSTNTVVSTIPVGNQPLGIALSSDGEQGYVTNSRSNTVTVFNTADSKVVTAINVGANPVSLGNFISARTGCDGKPVSFTITVNPTSASIMATKPIGVILACAGSPSISPSIQQFKVTGNKLTSGITATAPPGFQVSLAPGSGYGSMITLSQSGGNVSSVSVYVRSSASALAGSITGSVILSSAGAVSQNVTVYGNVKELPVVNAVTSQTVTSGAAVAPVSFSGTANTYTWVNNTPGIGIAANGIRNIASFTAVNTGTAPVTATITVTPENVPLAYITSSVNNSVSVINTVSNSIVATVPVGHRPFGISVNPDGSRVYVANNDDNTISVINTTNNAVIATISVGRSPRGIAVSPDGSTVYVTNQTDNTVSVINVANNTAVATIQVGVHPYGVCISPDGSTAYVGNSNSNTISVINTANNAVVGTITDDSPIGLVVNPDGTRLYVTNYFANTISVISTATQSVLATFPAVGKPISTGFGVSGVDPFAVAISADGSKLYVDNGNSTNVCILTRPTIPL